MEVDVDVDVLQDAGRAGPGQGGAVSAFALFHHQIAGLSNPPPCISLLADQIGCKKYYECSKCQLHPHTEVGPEWRVAAVTLVWCMSSDITPVHSMEALRRWS